MSPLTHFENKNENHQTTTHPLLVHDPVLDERADRFVLVILIFRLLQGLQVNFIVLVDDLVYLRDIHITCHLKISGKIREIRGVRTRGARTDRVLIEFPYSV